MRKGGAIYKDHVMFSEGEDGYMHIWSALPTGQAQGPHRFTRPPAIPTVRGAARHAMNGILYACQFLRVGKDMNGLNVDGLDFDGQDEQDLVAGADDYSRLAIDFCKLYTRVLR